MGIQVVIKSSGGNQRVEWLDGLGPLSVGRQQNCSLCIADEHISRQHALLHPEPTNLRVEDTSRNGTLVGRTLLRSSAMSVPYGTPICVGEHTLHVWSPRMRDCAAETTATPEPPGAPASGAKAEGAERADRAAEELPGELSRIAPSITIRPEAPGDVIAILRREVHRRLLAHLDLTDQAANDHDDPSLRPRVIAALRRIVGTLGTTLPPGVDEKRLIGELADEALGLGPLEQLLADTTVSEIMVVDARTVYVERDGKLMRTAIQFTDDEQLRAIIERIVTPLGRRIDEASPLVDARLGDGSRVNAIIKPLALRGPCITIRKFAHSGFALERLCELGTTDAAIGRFLSRCVIARKSIVVSGGTGSGKTTLLGALSAAIPEGERIVTIEDAAELRLVQPHVVSLETRPSNLEGQGSYAVRDLVKNALRMRPDRIVVGECRGAEALDMLQAMNTGHDGSLTTTHANSPREALARLETLALMANIELPSRALREQIGASVNVVVQIARLSDGSRKVTDVAEVCGLDRQGALRLRPIYRFVRTGTAPGGEVRGHFAATGYLPTFLSDFMVRGLVPPGEPYL